MAEPWNEVRFRSIQGSIELPMPSWDGQVIVAIGSVYVSVAVGTGWSPETMGIPSIASWSSMRSAAIHPSNAVETACTLNQALSSVRATTCTSSPLCNRPRTSYVIPGPARTLAVVTITCERGIGIAVKAGTVVAVGVRVGAEVAV